MDSIEIKSLHCSVHLGVSSEERETSQSVEIDLMLSLDLEEAGRTDDLSATVDYGEVVREVKWLAESKGWKLVEALAEAIAEKVLRDRKVEQVSVRLRKYPIVLRQQIDHAEVRITRRRV